MIYLDTELSGNVLAVLRKALWGAGTARADRETFAELKRHTVAALAVPVLKELSLPEDLHEEWKKHAVKTVYSYLAHQRFLAGLPDAVPYVILKGTAAAQYYPHPEYRAMGDVDIMTRHEDAAAFCGALLQNGFAEICETENKVLARHRQFAKNGIEVEVHNWYGHRSSVEQTEFLDGQIISHITETHVLPDMINGLTLIDHINFHLETGLGLRQVIDWMLFVHRCLPDGRWPEFRALVQKTGHERLAVTVTRMCEMYLGLPERKWCAGADGDTCRELMDYVLACGNFGYKLDQDEKASVRLLAGARSVKGFMHLLRKRGMINLGTQKYPILNPFVVLYQGARYLLKGLFRTHSIRKLKAEFSESRRRNRLLDALGATREQEGIVCYQNGEYRKTN